MQGVRGFDVIVVGARCAGSPLAARLAGAGVRVAVVDRARFPSEVPSTHGIQPHGVRSLERLGLLDELLAVTTPIVRVNLSLGGTSVTGSLGDTTWDPGAPMLNVRRSTLDRILLEAAARAGADIRTETTVTGLSTDDGRVTGVMTSHGALRGSLVVGADGPHSTVARLVGAEEYAITPSERTFHWCYLDGVDAPRDTAWIGKIGTETYLASPTDAGLYMVAVGVDHGRIGGREALYAEALAAWPELAAAVAGGTRVGPMRTMGRWHGYFRRSAGSGWALVGDAGHFKDPSPGQGIADALRQGERLAEAITASLSRTGDDRDRPLHDWWAWRDRDAWEMYWLAADMGAGGATPHLKDAVMARIASRPRHLERFFRTLDHDLAPSKLFGPELILGGMADAMRANRGCRRQVLSQAGQLARVELDRWSTRRRLPSRNAGPNTPSLDERTGARSRLRLAPRASSTSVGLKAKERS